MHRTCTSLPNLENDFADMRAAFGDGREAVLAREITKLFETVLDGTLASIADEVAADLSATPVSADELQLIHKVIGQTASMDWCGRTFYG